MTKSSSEATATAAALAEDPLDSGADYDPRGPDHGLMELKSEAELAEQMRERGFQFNYACHQDGNKDACHSLGQWLSMWQRRPAEGAAVFKQNCDLHGHAESCFKYANYKHSGPRGHAAGRHADCDPAEAAAYYARACDQMAHRRSCLCLGRMRLAEPGRPAADGLNLLRRACLGGGDPEGAGVACVTAAAEFLRAGRHAEARELAGAGCDHGDGMGCGLLAMMLRRGDGGPADAAAADRLSEQAKSMPSEYGRFLEQAKAQHRRGAAT